MKKENKNKFVKKLPMPGKVKKGFRFYCTVVLTLAFALGCSVTAFAANDPMTVVTNLSDFIFGLIRAVGLILLGWLSCRSAYLFSRTTRASVHRGF